MDPTAGNPSPPTCRYYSPAMLADLLGVNVSEIRSWQRRGLIRPVHQSAGVSWFDFSQLAAGRQLVQLLGQGLSPAALQAKLQLLARWIDQPTLAHLSLESATEGLVVRHQGQLRDACGQRRIEFGAEDPEEADTGPDTLPFRSLPAELADSESASGEAYRLKRLAEQLEDEGEIEEAIEVWRTFHLACGPGAESCFRLGELLYLTGDCAAARERYYMALEMDPTRVEVRTSLGCVLVELEEFELAISALRGALAMHPEFADAHFHLANALEVSGQVEQAAGHWQMFLDNSPAGPWADQARERLSRVTEWAGQPPGPANPQTGAWPPAQA